jgi:hypothetical protein
MYMAAHEAPGIHFESFVVYAVFQAVYNYIFILPSHKHIDPVYYSKRNKIKLFLIPEFIVTAHAFANF